MQPALQDELCRSREDWGSSLGNFQYVDRKDSQSCLPLAASEVDAHYRMNPGIRCASRAATGSPMLPFAAHVGRHRDSCALDSVLAKRVCTTKKKTQSEKQEREGRLKKERESAKTQPGIGPTPPAGLSRGVILCFQGYFRTRRGLLQPRWGGDRRVLCPRKLCTIDKLLMFGSA